MLMLFNKKKTNQVWSLFGSVVAVVFQSILLGFASKYSFFIFLKKN
jgi:hypothetical protein